MPCKDIKFSSKIKPFKIFEQSEMHWKNWKRRNFHSTTTEDGFNFSEYDKTAWINERDGLYKDLITGQEMEAAGVNVPAYGFFWLKKK